MRISISQQNYILGDFSFNFNKIENDIRRAISEQVDLIIFSELCVTGYPATDFFENSLYMNYVEETLLKIAKLSENIGILVGAPAKNPKIEGKDLFNSAYFMHEGQIKQVFHKALLPTYDVFEEYRYFEMNTAIFELLDFKGKKIAVTICEDIWNIGNDNPLYPICPMDELIKLSPDFMVNLSASPFSADHIDERRKIVTQNCERYQIPMIYCNCIGAQTEILFDGGSLIANAQGKILKELAHFEEDYFAFDLGFIYQENPIALEQVNKIDYRIKGLIMGIRDYFQKSGFSKAILGLSGGVDSALTLYLATQALGSEHVMSLLMPSEFSSNHSIDDSLKLCANLNCPFEIIPIKEIYNQYLTTLGNLFEGLPQDVTEENLQARIRGMLLMAYSNKKGHILLNTSNKSEMAVGYGTLYGDMCGALGVIGDLYKTQVYEMCEYINRNSEIIPNHILTKAPSAELRPNQTDQDSLPPYEVLDEILYAYVNENLGLSQISAKGLDSELVLKVMKMVDRAEFKRFQSPPILRISNKAFGFGRRIPIVAKYLTQL
ncbi:MAG: NAD+ synthase [Chitinophagales bacterium]|jgi:NAD+ synthase (glutamine-hydrolysing)|nr:NAD+ synthase [Chitinophagales bacterium]